MGTLSENLRKKLRTLFPENPGSHGVATALEEALFALDEGNFGVGASLVDEGGNVVGYGRNTVFEPYFNSMGHAEMILLNRYESESAADVRGQLTLITTLEPCLMCMGRIVLSKIRRVVFLARDQGGGASDLLSSFPVEFRRAAEGLDVRQYTDSEDVISLAAEIRDAGGDVVAKTLKQGGRAR